MPFRHVKRSLCELIAEFFAKVPIGELHSNDHRVFVELIFLSRWS